MRRRYTILVHVLRWRHNHNHPKTSDLEWFLKGELSSSSSFDDHSQQQHSKSIVPKGFLPVYVGSDLKRVVIPAAYLCMPEFREVMERAEEEFGFEQNGGLQLPCSVREFDDLIIRCKKNNCKPKAVKYVM